MTALLIRAEDSCRASDVGGKAAGLSALARAGFKVPPFFAVTADALNDKGLCDEARTALAQHLKELGTGPFAVRSSGREEDGAHHSHAGQFLTLLGVPKDGIEAAAAKVWASGATQSLRAYRESRGLLPDGGAPAVIVQRMLRPRVAGVMFSADPVSGCRDRIVISGVAGLADRLAGGEADGDDYVLDKTGAILEAPKDGVLTATDLQALAALARDVEAAQGTPQDIEWAFEGETLFLLQARAITTALHDPPIADSTIGIFDNSNIVESYPGIVSPLTYSFAQYVYARVYRIFVRILGVDENTIRDHGSVFENMLARIDGRVYYNLINWYRVLALLPGFAINRTHMETMMGVSEPLPKDIADAIAPRPAKGFALVRECLKIARVAFGLARENWRLKRGIAAFYARLNSALGPESEIGKLPLTALAGEYRRIESQMLERWDAPLINDFLCMIAFGASRNLMKRWAGAAGLELHNEVMIGQGDIVSAEPARRIAEMGAMAAKEPASIEALTRSDAPALRAHKALWEKIESYIAKFGDRCTEELKLESVTLREDARPLFGAIAAAARNTRGRETRAENRADPLSILFARKPIKRALARRVLAWAKARVRDRENLRFERTRIFGRARRLFLAMGTQLHAHGGIDEPRDVFYLTVPELLGAIEGFAVSQDLKGLAAIRKKEMEEAKTRPDPPERIAMTGAAIAHEPARAATPRPQSADTERSGTGCSAGIVKARARVVRDPRNEMLQPGEVLVARHTDPGWIALFSNASAIVVERGSLLSHSAIVAREMGIPCVVGLKGATEWLATGDALEVDGAAGIVRKHDG